MKYIKTFELVDYQKYIDNNEKTLDSNYYIYSKEPLTLDKIKKSKDVRVELHNRADASDTTSEYIYQIKTKHPLERKDTSLFGGDIFLFYDNDTKVKRINNEKFSGYFTKDGFTQYMYGKVKTADITSFKFIGGFRKYDKDYPEKLEIEISEETDEFLYSYISGSIMHKKLTENIKKELEQFKPKNKIKIFKGIEEVQIRHASKTQPPYKKGQIIKANFSMLTSWTTNVLVARRFIDDYPSSSPFVAEMIANPEDILVDVRLLPKQYYHTNQREIIMLNNKKYEFKLIWEGIL